MRAIIPAELVHYEGTVIRPPSEADSIIFQVTVGCSHNKCSFCGAYKTVRFRLKSDEELDSDITFAQKHCQGITRVFLADGDALIIQQLKLASIFEKIRTNLPWVKRFSLYANARAIRSKTDSDLKQLRKLGLARIYLGLESGDDRVLKHVNKGETAQSLLEAGKRVIESGIFLSTTVLLGLGGRENSFGHARKTAALLNQLKPNQIAALCLIPLANTRLGKEVENGSFMLPEPAEILQELRELLQNLTVDRVQFMANHASNYLPISGRLAKDKQGWLSMIDMAIRGEAPLVPEYRRSL